MSAVIFDHVFTNAFCLASLRDDSELRPPATQGLTSAFGASVARGLSTWVKYLGLTSMNSVKQRRTYKPPNRLVGMVAGLTT
jgi:hypothetical protein